MKDKDINLKNVAELQRIIYLASEYLKKSKTWINKHWHSMFFYKLITKVYNVWLNIVYKLPVWWKEKELENEFVELWEEFEKNRDYNCSCHRDMIYNNIKYINNKKLVNTIEKVNNYYGECKIKVPDYNPAYIRKIIHEYLKEVLIETDIREKMDDVNY